MRQFPAGGPFTQKFLHPRHIYQYAFSMIIGVFVLLTLWMNRA